MKTSFVLGLLLALGCGGGTKPGTATPADRTKAERPIDQWTTADEDKYIGLTCTKIVAPDHTLRCPILARIGFTADGCHDQLGNWRNRATTEPKRHAFRMLVGELSTAETCEAVEATFRRVAVSIDEENRKQARAAGCAIRDDNARDLTAEQAGARRGLNAKMFGDTASSTAEPIEVCGIKGELEWLTRVTCSDGSHPWGSDLDRAHEARSGSLTKQSIDACGGMTPLDLYVAPCPEKSYEVYMDMYMCGPGEDLSRGMRKL